MSSAQNKNRRFLLGNLAGFDARKDLVPFEQLPELERYMLHVLDRFVANTDRFYDELALQKVTQALSNFAVNDLSSFYFEITKDCLYLEHAQGLARRSTQTVLWHILQHFQRSILPIACYLAEDLYHFGRNVDPATAADNSLTSAILSSPPEHPSTWHQPQLEDRWRWICNVREQVFLAIQAAREVSKILERNMRGTLEEERGWAWPRRLFF